MWPRMPPRRGRGTLTIAAPGSALSRNPPALVPLPPRPDSGVCGLSRPQVRWAMTWARDDGHPPRAAEGGDGPQASDADSPRKITASGWRRILRRVAGHVLSDRLMVQSAGVAFFAVLSIAPVLVTAISVYGAVNTPEQALQQLSSVAGSLPPPPHSGGADPPTADTAA